MFMNTLDLAHIKHIHFIGIGGIGMSALARMFLFEGKTVSGSDTSRSVITDDLEKNGVKIFYTQTADNISSDVDLVVYTIAISKENPELSSAIERGIFTHTYSEMLGVVSKEKFTIAVSGTHGKTTTTAMIAKILIDAGLDPTVIVGSLLSDQKSNFVAGKSKYFVVEACEYKRSFLNLHPNILAITNIEEDHLDYYKDIKDIQSAFRELAGKIGPKDFLVCNPNDKNLPEVVSGLSVNVCDYTNIDSKISLIIPGEHNKKNARLAVTVALILGVSEEDAIKSLASFNGTWRRFEYKGKTKKGAMVYDDYAHHPTEVRATLSSAREMFPDKKIIVIFQPHLYSRTKDHLKDFGSAFSGADSVFCMPIYAAREPFDPSISSEILVKEIEKNTSGLASFITFDDAKNVIESAGDSDVIFLMGAGDINKVADTLGLYV